MPYPAFVDHRMPFDNDGTVLATRGHAGPTGGGVTDAELDIGIDLGIASYPTQGDVIELNDNDFVALTTQLNIPSGSVNSGYRVLWFFFPERREVTGLFTGAHVHKTWSATLGLARVEGSDDTTNGVDGTWETASLPAGQGISGPSLDNWRSTIKAISFTGGKKTARISYWAPSQQEWLLVEVGLYGEKVAGQTIHDLIFINHDDTPGVEYAAVEDFGDRPLGTSVVRQFRIKNTSASRTAAEINIQCNDPDFAISTDNVNWVVTINIASLAPGAESATMYIRNTTPAAGNLLGPRMARLVVVAEQDGVADSNFYDD